MTRMTALGFDETLYPAGTHMCYIFNDDQERREVLAKFVESGLQTEEQVAYFVDTLSPEDLKKSLADLGVKLPESDQCMILDAGNTYCPDGTFEVNRMLSTLESAHKQCCSAGFKGLRVTGEMNWALKGLPGSEHLIEYESRVTEVLQSTSVTAICQYDARLFDGELLYELMKVHPMMIVKGRVIKNPYYVDYKGVAPEH